jgi:hypothetical protein
MADINSRHERNSQIRLTEWQMINAGIHQLCKEPFLSRVKKIFGGQLLGMSPHTIERCDTFMKIIWILCPMQTKAIFLYHKPCSTPLWKCF